MSLIKLNAFCPSFPLNTAFSASLYGRFRDLHTNRLEKQLALQRTIRNLELKNRIVMFYFLVSLLVSLQLPLIHHTFWWIFRI